MSRYYGAVAVKGAGQGPARRPLARRKATRDSVVDAALRLFAKQGYLAVRVQDIAREAGISRATFYKYFSEREEILAGLFERLLGAESEPDSEALGITGSTEVRITALLVSAATKMLEQEQLARFVYSLPVRHSALLRPGSTATPYVLQHVRQLLEQGMNQGDVRADLSLDLLTLHVHAALEMAMRDWAEGNAQDPLGHLRNLIRLAFHGIDG
ncbi:MAG TPA: TetR/AcrR family transcriptional regulator [Candidatus Nanopelagicaceae bacterium]|nr:TetR/AcrR family transcriptional regulator [Candidatus Nanopelagicaceae bacterium]